MRLPELQFRDGQLERLVPQLANEGTTLFVEELADLGIRTEPLLAAFEELRDHDNFLTRHVRMAGEAVLAAAYGEER